MPEIVLDRDNASFPERENTGISLSKINSKHGISIKRIVKIFLQKEIEVDSTPDTIITKNQYKIFVEALREYNKEYEFRKGFRIKYSQGSVVRPTITRIIYPSQIITEFSNGFIGRLSLLDMSWCFPAAQQKFSSLTIGEVVECAVIEIDFENKQVKLGQKQTTKYLSDSIQWDRLDRGDEMEGTIIEELNTSFIVKSDKGFYGTLNKQYCNEKIGDLLKVRVHSKSDESDLLTFIPASLEVISEIEKSIELNNDFGRVEPELRDFKSFKRSMLGAQVSDSDLLILRSAFEKYSNLFTKEIELAHTIYISFELKSNAYETTFKQNAVPYFFEGEVFNTETENKLLEKLSNENYWVRFNQRNKDEKGNSFLIEFSFFNEEINFFGEVLISKNKKEYRFVIKNFTFGHSFKNSSESKKRNAKYGAFLYRSPIRIISPFFTLPPGDSQKIILDSIIEKTKCFEIINKLKQEAGEILREEGRTLAIINKFLEYQESLLDANKGQSIFVDKFERTNSEAGDIALFIDGHIGDSLEIDETTQSIVTVKLKQGKDSDEELLWFTDGSLSYSNDKCKLSFFKEINTDNLKKGFFLEKRISKRQLQVQREIIQDFLMKKLKIDHIESLLIHPDKIKTPILSTINLINEDLVITELEQPGNNQIKAVRKALGNQNIFLIQGPPGTGKTTVIAEIIEQLVAKGEKILVAGQNHVAVDNVLTKIALIPKLNLLRVGKEEKIDKELGRYHIDQLVTDYQAIFNLFLLNQLSLIKHFYDYQLNNVVREILIKDFNARVNECCANYGALKEILKHKHFILLDSLTDLTSLEIKETIISYENWITSINNEIEILLKPLIYNSVDVVFATCIGIKTDSVFRESEFKFDTVIIDEAGKSNIAETLVAIELGKKVILVGDQMQLPPYIDSSLIDITDPKSFPRSKYGYGFLQDEIIHALKTSFFEFLIKRIEVGKFPKENLEMLNYQHRMHPNIGEFISKSFYDGKVKMGSRTHLNKLDFPPPFNKEVIFFDTSNASNPFEQTDGYSAKNNTEAESISENILPKLFENNISPREIAIIAPYKSQVANILKFINNSSLCKHKNIDVSTLDSFQGKEYDIIIFSFTRSTDHRKAQVVNDRRKFIKVGFLDDARRLNVAFSRAKKKLILIGNAISLTDPKSHFDFLFNYTSLFKNLVAISKQENIGNFVTTADSKDFKNQFDKFIEKYKIGDSEIAKFEMIGKGNAHVYGVFFLINNFKCLLPASFIPLKKRNELMNLKYDTNIKVTIHDIDKKQKRVTLKLFEEPSKSELWYTYIPKYKEGMKVKAKIISIKDFGYFAKLDCGLEGLLHNSKIRNKISFSIDQEIDVIIIRIDNSKKQIAFSLA